MARPKKRRRAAALQNEPCDLGFDATVENWLDRKGGGEPPHSKNGRRTPKNGQQGCECGLYFDAMKSVASWLTLDHVWLPYTQMKGAELPLPVVSAIGRAVAVGGWAGA